MELRLLRQGNVIGKSAAFKRMREQIEIAAKSESPVLICGEIGAGKEYVAEEIHNLSVRRWKPFVVVNLRREPMGAIVTEWVGAQNSRLADTRLADTKGGTLFLDEISAADMRTQSVLSRALEYGQLSPFDDDQSTHCDARIIAATSVSLEDAVERERFEVDLLRRLETIRIDVPSVRDRQEDIPLLVDYFLKFIRKEYRLDIDGITLEAMDRLIAYSWPGNIRELKNALLRAAVCLGSGTIGVDSLPERFSRGAAIPELPRSFARISPNLLGMNGKNKVRSNEPQTNILVLRQTSKRDDLAVTDARRSAMNGRIGNVFRKRAQAIQANSPAKSN